MAISDVNTDEILSEIARIKNYLHVETQNYRDQL